MTNQYPAVWMIYFVFGIEHWFLCIFSSCGYMPFMENKTNQPISERFAHQIFFHPLPPLESLDHLRFIIALLKKEDDSLYRSQLLIVVWISVPPPPPSRAKRVKLWRFINPAIYFIACKLRDFLYFSVFIICCWICTYILYGN